MTEEEKEEEKQSGIRFNVQSSLPSQTDRSPSYKSLKKGFPSQSSKNEPNLKNLA